MLETKKELRKKLEPPRRLSIRILGLVGSVLAEVLALFVVWFWIRVLWLIFHR